MAEVFQSDSVAWEPVRPAIAQGVYGRTLLADGVKAVLTRVAPGGKFAMHKDNYAHLFYFLSGKGTVAIEDKQYEARAGLVVRVAAGEMHAYENTGAEDLVLLSLNLPTT